MLVRRGLSNEGAWTFELDVVGLVVGCCSSNVIVTTVLGMSASCTSGPAKVISSATASGVMLLSVDVHLSVMSAFNLSHTTPVGGVSNIASAL